ncbi:hypothetical protein AA313_de0201819 [Arthrobotrys entomopaga]|nr:hypothetical protein AA313_de0201819 [Arthrobotrys entomopaga]
MRLQLLSLFTLLTPILSNPLPSDETSTAREEGHRLEYPNPDNDHPHNDHTDDIVKTPTTANLHPTVPSDFTLDRSIPTTIVALDNPFPDADDISAQAALDASEIFGTAQNHPHDQDGDPSYNHRQHPKKRQAAAIETVMDFVTKTIVDTHPQYTPQNAQAGQQDQSSEYKEVQIPPPSQQQQPNVNTNPQPEKVPEQEENNPLTNSIPMSPPHVPRTLQTSTNDTDSETETDQEDSDSTFPPPLLIKRGKKKPLGINCRGKAWCGLDLTSNKHLSSTLLHVLESSLPDDRVFAHKELIACVRGISYLAGQRGFLCAWFDFADNEGKGYWEHRTGNINGKRVKVLAKEIVMHDCQGCGSVPIAYPGSNDGSQGYLTFNARRHGCPSELYRVDGICGSGGEGVPHDVLVGGEVDKTSNGTSDGDGYINDPNTLDMANSNPDGVEYIPDRKPPAKKDDE